MVKFHKRVDLFSIVFFIVKCSLFRLNSLCLNIMPPFTIKSFPTKKGDTDFYKVVHHFLDEEPYFNKLNVTPTICI